MPTNSNKNPTLIDVAKRLDPKGKVDNIVEIMAETNEILEDMTFLEGNLPTGHKTTIRSGIPTPTWRKLYKGVQPSKSKTVQVTDNCGMLEAYAEVDKDIADLNGNTKEFRLSEDEAHIEGMNQELASTLFYGDEGVNSAKFTGLAPRFNDTQAENGGNIILGDGAGSDNTSIWLVVWGPRTLHGIYPQGSKGGLKMTDKGQVTIEAEDGSGKYEGYRSHYKMDVGLTLRNWKYVVRIANVDVKNLTKDAASGADLIDLLDQAIEKIPSLKKGRAVIYCNATIKSFLRRQAKNHKNVNLTLDNVDGGSMLRFDEVPIKRCDAILDTEEKIA